MYTKLNAFLKKESPLQGAPISFHQRHVPRLTLVADTGKNVLLKKEQEICSRATD